MPRAYALNNGSLMVIPKTCTSADARVQHEPRGGHDTFWTDRYRHEAIERRAAVNVLQVLRSIIKQELVRQHNGVRPHLRNLHSSSPTAQSGYARARSPNILSENAHRHINNFPKSHHTASVICASYHS